MEVKQINISAGHNPDGMVACGAIGLIKESTEARKVTAEVIELLKDKGYTVYDCTCNNGTSQSDVLKKIVAKCNAHDVDLDISIHFNAGRSDLKGDGDVAGCEVCIPTDKSKTKPYATAVCNEIHKLGFDNRGISIRENLYFLNKTKAPAMLIECCFVDDKDDVKLYTYKSMAKSIVKGIMSVK